jgi:hypothetical protein
MSSLDHLNKIERVEVSPFLLTRIKAKIKSQSEEVVTPKLWMITASCVVCFLLVNVYFITKFSNHFVETELVAQSMHIYTNNQIYE